MSQLVNLPKPSWRDMVAPYRAAPDAPTIRTHLQHFPGWLWVSRQQTLWAVPLAPYIQRYGLDVTLLSLLVPMKAESMSLATFGRNNEYRFPPIDRVPPGLRRYALIDPSHLPAPLRGQAAEGAPARA